MKNTTENTVTPSAPKTKIIMMKFDPSMTTSQICLQNAVDSTRKQNAEKAATAAK